MEAGEKKAFEAILLQNHALLEEVEAYKEIRLLGESIEGKINVDQQLPQKKSEHEAVWKILQQERKHWEDRHEAPSKHLHHSNPSPATVPCNKNKGKKRRMTPLTWLAVATVAGIFALALFWFYQPVEKNKPQLSSTNQPGSPETADSRKYDTPANTLQSSSYPVKPPSSSPAPVRAKQIKKKEAARQQLFTTYFAADSLPFQLPDALSAPSSLYENQQYKEAITGYRQVLAALEHPQEEAPATRSLHEELTGFYARYYLAQTLLSVNRTSEAARELEEALKESPNTYWSSKTRWYLALACLRLGQTKKTKTQLQQVIRQDPSEIYSLKAKQLARNLEKE